MIERTSDAHAAGGVWERAAAAAAAAAPFATSEAETGLRLLRRPIVREEVASTQDELRSLAGAGAPAGTVVIAERQVQGRGRSGRSWDDSAQPGGSLALSFLLDVPARGAHLVPHAVGLGVLEAIDPLVAHGRSAGSAQLGLKWPNDVVVATADAAPRKLAGTLVEREQLAGRDLLLVGLGLNVDRRDEAQLADRTCLATVAGDTVDLALLLARLLPALDRAIGQLATPTVLLDAYRRRCSTIGRHVVVEQPGSTTLVGVATGVDADGRLEVATSDGTVSVLAGTVRDASSEPEGRGASDAERDRP